MTPETAMKQAGMTAMDYLSTMKREYKEELKNGTMTMGNIIELCKVAAMDYHSSAVSGLISN